MTKLIALSSAATIPLVFASGKATAPATEPAATSNKGKPRSVPDVLTVRTDVPMPEIVTKRAGGRSAYRFDELAIVGASFGIKGKTAEQLRQVVSKANKAAAENVTPLRDEAGNVVFKTQSIPDGSGGFIEAPTNEPKMTEAAVFFVVDTDPKTDPDGASARVFRKA